MSHCIRQFGYSLIVVTLIAAVIAIIGMMGAQKIFDTTMEDTRESELYITGTGKLAEYSDKHLLAQAVRKGHTDLVRMCLRAGSNPNMHTSSGGTPLHRAAARGLVDIARLLLDYGADVNAPNPKSITPLHLAAANGHIETVQLLIDYDANLNPKNDDGDRPLTVALNAHTGADSTDKSTRQKYENVINLLREWGAKK